MATFLDLTGLEQFSKVFIFILVIVVAYALISNSNISGTAKWISWLLALIIAIFVILSDAVTMILKGIIPWVGILFVFVIFIMIAGKTMGAGGKDFMEFKWVLLVLTIVVFLIAAAFTIRENAKLPGDIDEDGNVIEDKDYVSTSNFLFHPTMLGIIFILLVGIFTVALLAGKSS